MGLAFKYEAVYTAYARVLVRSSVRFPVVCLPTLHRLVFVQRSGCKQTRVWGVFVSASHWPLSFFCENSSSKYDRLPDDDEGRDEYRYATHIQNGKQLL